MAQYVGLGTLITPHGCEVDVGGWCPMTDSHTMLKPESKFLSGQTKCSQPGVLSSDGALDDVGYGSVDPFPPYVHLVST